MAFSLRTRCCSPSKDTFRRCVNYLISHDASVRQYAAAASPGIRNTNNVFDRKVKRIQKNRAALAENVAVYDYLKDHVARSVVERLRDVTRTFPLALDLGCGRGHISKHIGKGLIDALVQCDLSDGMVEQSPAPGNAIASYRLIADEEFLPFKENTFDLVVSSLSLHWVNDLPSTLRQIRKVLKEDGLFIGCMMGGDSLYQLRSALQVAETKLKGGFVSHVSPFAGVSDVSSLLSGAGLAITTVDPDEITIHYPGIREVLKDLRGMGESNAATARPNIPLTRGLLNTAEQVYREMYGETDEKHGSVIPLTFDIIHMIGWKPSASQPKPAPRGSGTKDVLAKT